MGGEPWQCVCPFESNAADTFKKHQEEIKRSTSRDWEGNVRFDEQPFDVDDDSAFLHVRPVPTEMLLELFETTTPTKEQVLRSDIWEKLDRGKGCYVVCYLDGKPDTVCFMGYSFD